jgi:hypothetical protein
MSTTTACPKNLVANGIQLLERSGHPQLRVVLAHDPAKCERFAEKDLAQLQKNLERDLATTEGVCPTKSRIHFCGSRAMGKPDFTRIGRGKIVSSQENPRGPFGRGDFDACRQSRCITSRPSP